MLPSRLIHPLLVSYRFEGWACIAFCSPAVSYKCGLRLSKSSSLERAQSTEFCGKKRGFTKELTAATSVPDCCPSRFAYCTNDLVSPCSRDNITVCLLLRSRIEAIEELLLVFLELGKFLLSKGHRFIHGGLVLIHFLLPKLRANWSPHKTRCHKAPGKFLYSVPSRELNALSSEMRFSHSCGNGD